MVTRVRSVLGAAVVLCALGVLPGAPASAAGSNCPAVDVPTSTKTAQAVFEGTVAGEATTTAKPDGSRGALYQQPVSVQTVFQGRIRTDTVQVQTDRTPKECSLGPLTVGTSYVFFVQGTGDPWVAVSGAGTSSSSPELVASVESILGAGRPPVQPTPEQATFTSMHPAAPQTFTRTAAPGAALLLVGLLGLALTRNRRSAR